MALYDALEGIKRAPFSAWIQDTPGVVPGIQTIHIIGVALFFPALLLLALRLTGLTLSRYTVRTVAERLTPWMWTGLGLLIPTGLLLFLEDPANLYWNMGFRWKMALLVVGAISLAAFEIHRRKRPGRWEAPPSLVTGALALTVLAVWAGVITSGRWIAYLAYF